MDISSGYHNSSSLSPIHTIRLHQVRAQQQGGKDMHMLSSPKQRCCAYALAIQRWQYSAGNTTLPHNLSGRAGALDIDSWICPAIAHTHTTHTRLKNLQNPAGKQAKASPTPRLAGLVASCKCSNSSKNSYNSYNNGQICMRVGVLLAHSHTAHT